MVASVTRKPLAWWLGFLAILFCVRPPSAIAAQALKATLLGIGGIYAGADFDVHFSLLAGDAAGTPVTQGEITAEITMPSMPGMPSIVPVVHGESFPGCYGVMTLFPHGGRYRITVRHKEADGSVASGSFDVDVADAPENGVAPPPPFFATLATNGPAVVGKPVEISLTVHRRGSTSPWTDLEIVHEKPWHLMVVSHDLRWFHHIHPVALPDGSYRVTETFPAGGNYLLLSDVSPRNAGQQFLPVDLHVGGAPFATPYKLRVSTTDRVIGGLRVHMDAPTQIKAHTDLTLTFTLKTPDGRPATDLQPYLGAMGHLVIVHQDRTRFVHSHPVGSTLTSNGVVPFLVRFPKPGLYKAWAQFQRNGEVLTADFVLRVLK